MPALLALSPLAWAEGDAPSPAPKLVKEPRWPESLRHRNARYAVLDRVQDFEGDAHEAFLAQADVRRWHDRAGDREEDYRYFAVLRKRSACSGAFLQRTSDREGDVYQAYLASLPVSRGYAVLARDRDLMDDYKELARYRRDVVVFGEVNRSDRTMLATQEDDPAGRARTEASQDREEEIDETGRREEEEDPWTRRDFGGEPEEEIEEIEDEIREIEGVLEGDLLEGMEEFDLDLERLEGEEEAVTERAEERAEERAAEAADREDERAEERQEDREVDESLEQADTEQ